MQDSSLIQLLRSFDKDQLKNLEKFLRSPYHNTNNNIIKLLQYIKRYYPELNNPKLSKEHAFYQLFPEKPFKDSTIRKQMSLLKVAVEEFVKVEALKKEENIQNRLLVDYYYKIEDFDAFEKRIQNWIEKLQAEPLRDASYHLEMLWLCDALFYHPRNKDHYRFRSNDQLNALLSNLDFFYLLTKLRIEADLNIRKKVVNEQIKSPIPFKGIATYAASLAKSSKLISLYRQLLDFQNHESPPEPADFEYCIQEFRANMDQMDEKESGFILNVLVNTAIGFQNSGDQKFLDLTVQLYQLADEQDQILHQGQIQTALFLNLTFAGCGAGKFQWVESLISKYGPYLAENDRESAINLSWGIYFYYRSKLNGTRPVEKTELLDKALEHINAIPYSGMGVDLRLRALQLRILYDRQVPSGNTKLFYDYIRAFEKYLTDRKDFSEERRKSYLQFVRFTRKMAGLYGNYLDGYTQTEALQKLRKKIEKNRKVAMKHWLLKGVEELEQFPH